MKLEEYIEVKGALRTKKFRQVIEDNISKKSGDKILTKKALTVIFNSITFDADIESISYMSAVISLANFKVNFLQTQINSTTSTNYTQAEAFTEVYLNTIVRWKDYSNTWIDTDGSTIAGALESAMNASQTIIV